MRDAEIDKLIKNNLKTKASCELDRRIDNLIAQAESQTGTSNIWREIMQSRITKSIAVAMIIISAIVFLVNFNQTQKDEKPKIANDSKQEKPGKNIAVKSDSLESSEGRYLMMASETIPPGKYDCYGRVVKRNDGSYAVFWGGGCHYFPGKISDKLRPYLGKFVKVDYTLSGDEHGLVYFSSIDKVSVIADSDKKLPVVVSIKPTKKTYDFSEPVHVKVSFTNSSDLWHEMLLKRSLTRLCQDYKVKHSLEPDSHYKNSTPYGFNKGIASRVLAPGEKVEFEVISQQMAEPGTYQLVYSLSVGDTKLRMQSNIEEITVRKPESDDELHRGLKKWLKIVSKGQQIKIAERLHKLGDNSGTKEILRLLEANEYSKDHYCNGSAFRYAWQYGGSKGEKVMLSLIKRQTKHDYVNRMVESIYLTSNRIELLKDLLSSTHPTRRISKWIDKPRICDITASWLMGYTDGKMTFPKKGSIEQRDQAVESVKKMLDSNPAFFRVLSKEYK